MKRLLSLILVLSLLFGSCMTLASCDIDLGTDENGATLKDAINYLKEEYGDLEGEETDEDFTLPTKIKVDGTKFTVEWSVNTSVITVTNGKSECTVDLPDENEEDLDYTLTATVEDSNGKTKTFKLNLVLPDFTYGNSHPESPSPQPNPQPNPNPNPSNDFVMPEGGYDGSAVTITFYHTMNTSLRSILNEYIAEFNKLYPNITIEHVNIGGYDDLRDQIIRDLTVGNLPNIAYCYSDHVALYNLAGSVLPLDDLIASTVTVTDALGNETVIGLTEEQLYDFIPGFLAEGRMLDEEGTTYTLPMSKSTEVLYYNKTFFDEHNIPIPTTWEEMEAVCEYIKAFDPYCIPLGYDSEANWFITMAEQYGSGYTSLDENNHFIFDNDTNKSFVKKFNEWYRKGYVTTSEIYGSYTSNLFTATGNSTKCYMVIGSTAGASYYTCSDEVGITSIPQVDTYNPKVISQGPSICIFKDQNPQEVIASWLFVEFLTTNSELQAALSMQSGYTPVIRSAADHPIYREWLNSGNGDTNLTAYAVRQALSQMDAYFVSPAFNGSSAARNAMIDLMINALTYRGEDDDLIAYINKIFADAVEECEYQIS